MPKATFRLGVGRTLRFRAHLTDRRDAQQQWQQQKQQKGFFFVTVTLALSPADQPYSFELSPEWFRHSSRSSFPRERLVPKDLTGLSSNQVCCHTIGAHQKIRAYAD